MTSIIPGTSETAREYFRRLKRERAASERALEIAEEPIEILEPGRELSADELRKLKGALGSLIRRLTGREWTIRVGESVAHMPAVRYENDGNDHNRGDIRYPAYIATLYEVFAHKRAGGKVVGLLGSWLRKGEGSLSFQGAMTTDPILGEEWRPTASKPRPQRDWEAAEGVAPPMAFNEWAKLVAPTAAELKKKEAVND